MSDLPQWLQSTSMYVGLFTLLLIGCAVALATIGYVVQGIELFKEQRKEKDDGEAGS